MSREPVFKRARRKSSKKQKHGPSVNKYAHLVPKRRTHYAQHDKTFRNLPVIGTPGETVKAGYRTTFHGRLYSLVEDVVIPDMPTTPIESFLPEGKSTATGRFKLVAVLD